MRAEGLIGNEMPRLNNHNRELFLQHAIKSFVAKREKSFLRFLTISNKYLTASRRSYTLSITVEENFANFQVAFFDKFEVYYQQSGLKLEKDINGLQKLLLLLRPTLVHINFKSYNWFDVRGYSAMNETANEFCKLITNLKCNISLNCKNKNSHYNIVNLLSRNVSKIRCDAEFASNLNLLPLNLDYLELLNVKLSSLLIVFSRHKIKLLETSIFEDNFGQDFLNNEPDKTGDLNNVKTLSVFCDRYIVSQQTIQFLVANKVHLDNLKLNYTETTRYASFDDLVAIVENTLQNVLKLKQLSKSIVTQTLKVHSRITIYPNANESLPANWISNLMSMELFEDGKYGLSGDYNVFKTKINNDHLEWKTEFFVYTR